MIAAKFPFNCPCGFIGDLRNLANQKQELYLADIVYVQSERNEWFLRGSHIKYSNEVLLKSAFK